MRRLLRGAEGSSAVETAVVLPVFFVFLFGFFSFSIVLFGYGNATYAARAATRYAALHSGASRDPCNAACVQSYATAYMYGVPAKALTVTVAYSPSDGIGSTVQVSITVDYSASIPFFPARVLAVGSSAQRTISR